MHSYDEPVYLISVVASMLDIHPQTTSIVEYQSSPNFAGMGLRSKEPFTIKRSITWS